MVHQGMPGMPGSFLTESVKPMVRTCLVVLLIFMLILYWQIGYIINAATVCKYIAMSCVSNFKVLFITSKCLLTMIQ